MKKLELSDEIVSVEMSVTQAGIVLSALHTAIEETEDYLGYCKEGTEEYKEAKWFNDKMHDVAYNFATILMKAAEEE